MTYIGSLDQGTSSTRFMIFDHSGKVVGQHQLEHRQIMSHPGWVEHDASEIWQRVQEVIAGALKQADILGSDLVAIGITNQRETTVVWDVTTGQALSNAIVWQDVRTSKYCQSLIKDTELNDYVHEYCPKTYLAVGKLGVFSETGDLTEGIQKTDSIENQDKVKEHEYS